MAVQAKTVQTKKCRSCRAEIVWARNEAGRRVAVEPEPAGFPDGSLRLIETERHKLLVFERRWRGGIGYGFGVYRGDPSGVAKEWFGLYRYHSCAETEPGEAIEVLDEVDA